MKEPHPHCLHALANPAQPTHIDENKPCFPPSITTHTRSRKRTQLVIVGDPDQLPPVGPGAPLRAAIDAGLLPLVDLRQIFRQSGASAIVRGAHSINMGACVCCVSWNCVYMCGETQQCGCNRARRTQQ